MATDFCRSCNHSLYCKKADKTKEELDVNAKETPSDITAICVDDSTQPEYITISKPLEDVSKIMTKLLADAHKVT